MDELGRRPDISEELRWKVLKRDHYRCRYCGRDTGPFHMDHVYPFSLGGETTYNNLVTACDKCNMQKHDAVGKWPFPIGYFEQSETITPNAKMGLAIMAGVMALANASYFQNEGFTLAAVILFVFGLVVSMWGSARLIVGYSDEV